MRLLAIESSTDLLSVALLIDGEVIERVDDRSNGGVNHSDSVLPLVKELLEFKGTELSFLDAIAFGSGPGAFTGLRLACGVAQGLAIGVGLPVIGIPSLEALAWAFAEERNRKSAENGAAPDSMFPQAIYTCMDARMNEVYCAAYRILGDTVETVLEPVVVAPQQAPLPLFPALPEFSLLSAADDAQKWRGVGNGFAVYGEALKLRFAGCLENIADTDGASAKAVPRASAIARLAAPRLARGEGVDPALATPLYVRNKIAFTTEERLARGGKA